MQKIKRYLSEIGYCLQTGAGLGDKFRLGANTMKFHASNMWKSGADKDGATLKNYRLQWNGRDIDLWLRTLGGDIFIFYEIFLDEVYKIPKAWVNGVHTVVDLGANIGLTGLYFDSLFPDANFICVEPNPYNLPVLRKNVTSFSGRVHVVEGAISDHSGHQLFDAGGRAWESKLGNNSYDNNNDNFDRLTVRLYSMPEIIDGFGLSEISLLKIDVEGAEVDLLRNGAEWLEIVNTIIIELHGNYSVEHLRADVKKFGLEVYPPNQTLGNNMIVATRLGPGSIGDERGR